MKFKAPPSRTDEIPGATLADGRRRRASERIAAFFFMLLIIFAVTWFLGTALANFEDCVRGG